MSYLIPLPVILPLLGAGVTLMLSRRPRLQRAVSVAILAAVVCVAAALVVQADRHGPQVLWIGAWQEPLGIALVADRLSALMVLVSAIVTLAVLVYSIGQGMTGDEHETPVTIYHPTYLVLVAGVSNAFLAGDLFNLFVSFEILLFASYVLLTLGGTGARIRAGTIYVVVNVLSSSLFLISLAAVYAATGSLNLAQLSGRLADLPDSVSLVLQLLLLTTFSIKAAVFPLSFWLPDSYPTAPAPVTAVFAGLLTKVGVYAIIRTQTLLFPDSPLTDLLLSFTLVSHIGYMIFGGALGTTAGYSGAIFYVAHHITIQTALFLVLGLIERRAGSTSLLKIGGLARVAPLVAVLFFVPAMNLAGIPPMSGFLGKVALTQAGLQVATPLAYVLVGAGMLTSLLTLYAVAKAWNLAFLRTPEQAHDMALAISDVDSAPTPVHVHRNRVDVGPVTLEVGDIAEARSIVDPADDTQDFHQLLKSGSLPSKLPMSMVGATAALIATGLALTVIAGPAFAYTDHAAEDILDPGAYVTAVLSQEAP